MNFHTLLTDAKRWGWTSTLFTRVAPRLERLLGMWIFVVKVRNLADPPQEPSTPPVGITARVLDPAQALRCAHQEPEFELDPEFIRQAAARGDRAYAAFQQDKLVGYTLRSSSTAPFFDGLWIGVPRPLDYSYKEYTLSSHRGRGIYRAFASLADYHSSRRGHRVLFSLIDISNIASLCASRMMGGTTAGYAGYLRLFGRCFSFRTPRVRALGIVLYTPADQRRI